MTSTPALFHVLGLGILILSIWCLPAGATSAFIAAEQAP